MAKEPELDLGTQILCRAYSELSTCRSVGFSMGPIPWTAMLAWAEHHNLEREVTDHLINVLRVVDAETLRRAAARAREQGKGQ